MPFNASNLTLPNLTSPGWNFNLSNYTEIKQFMNMSNASDYFIPVKYWTNVMGAWFYVMIVYLTIGMVFVKTRSIFPTSIALLFLSAVMAANLPTPVSLVLYSSLVLGVFGVLYSIFARE